MGEKFVRIILDDKRELFARCNGIESLKREDGFIIVENADGQGKRFSVNLDHVKVIEETDYNDTKRTPSRVSVYED